MSNIQEKLDLQETQQHLYRLKQWQMQATIANGEFHWTLPHSKPAETESFREDLAISINPKTLAHLQDSLQQRMYFYELETLGQPLSYQLRRTPSDTYYLVGPKDEIIPPTELFYVYAFVIVKNPLSKNELKLRLGNSNHNYIAECANQVIAAGDIYFDKAGHIIKITDQSGGYHVECDDPKGDSKRAQAKRAMEVVGLPMNKFQAFMVDVPATVPAKEILFSQVSRPSNDNGFGVEDKDEKVSSCSNTANNK